MNNLELYNKVREVPKEAKKDIQAGRLKGKTDINPMWRIKSLTENFGMIGVGWYYNITKQWLEEGSNGEIAAFINIELFVKVNGEWSMPIVRTGGSSFVAKESKGLYVSDECFKMALTDAISVSCKALGFGANVYWDKDSTKYGKQINGTNETESNNQSTLDKQVSSEAIIVLKKMIATKDVDSKVIDDWIKVKYKKSIDDLTVSEYKKVLAKMDKTPDKIQQDTSDLFNTQHVSGT